jgi:hypothetical protein
MDTTVRDLGEGIRNLAAQNVAVSVGVGLLAADVVYRLVFRAPLRRALGVPT